MRWMIALLLAAALSGCLGSEDGPKTESEPQDNPASGTDSGTEPTETEANETSEPGDPAPQEPNPSQPTANGPPVVELTATNQSIAPGQTVTVTLAATDPDDDTIGWDLDLDGDGTFDETGFDDLPRSFEVSFAQAGNYTLKADVSAGDHTVSSTLRISVVEPPVPEGPAPVEYTGTVFIPSVFYNLGASCTEDFLISAGTAGNAGEVHNLPAELIGWTYEVEGDGVVVGFFGAGSGLLANGGTQGTVPGGAEQMGVCGDTAIATDYVVTLRAP